MADQYPGFGNKTGWVQPVTVVANGDTQYGEMSGWTQPVVLAQPSPQPLELYGVSVNNSGAANATAINAAIASGGWFTLATPGTFEVGASIEVPSNTRIELGPNTTIKLAASSNCAILTNSDHTNGNENIQIVGGTWDANWHEDNGTYGTAPLWSGWGIGFINCTRTLIQNTKHIGSVKYCILIAGGSIHRAYNLNFDSYSDGYHVLGGTTNVVVDGLTGYTGDNIFALTPVDYATFRHTEGDISDVVARNIRQTDARLDMVRVIGGTATGSVQTVVRNVLLENLTGQAYVPVNITGATNASPIRVTAVAHGLLDRRKIVVGSVGGNTAANGTWYAKVIDEDTIDLYQNAALTTPVAGNGAYTSGGTVSVGNAMAFQMIADTTGPLKIENMTIRGVRFKSNTNTSIGKFEPDGGCDSFVLEDVHVDQSATSLHPFSLNTAGGTVQRMVLKNIHIKGLAFEFAQLKNIVSLQASDIFWDGVSNTSGYFLNFTGGAITHAAFDNVRARQINAIIRVDSSLTGNKLFTFNGCVLAGGNINYAVASVSSACDIHVNGLDIDAQQIVRLNGTGYTARLTGSVAKMRSGTAWFQASSATISVDGDIRVDKTAAGILPLDGDRVYSITTGSVGPAVYTGTSTTWMLLKTGATF